MRTLLILILFLTLNISNSFSQKKDSLIYKYHEKFKIYKELSSNTYSIKKNDKKIFFENLKFYQALIGGKYMQILDDKNKISYINYKGKKIRKKENLTLMICGTGVKEYHYKIIEKGEHYFLIKNEYLNDLENTVLSKKIDSIHKKGIEKINFSNGKKEINYNSESFIFNYTKTFPNALIIDFNQKQGILYEKDVQFFDKVTYKSGLFKVKINNKLGYYGITEVKYIELDDFEYSLARFKTIDNKTGYIDSEGNEYYE